MYTILSKFFPKGIWSHCSEVMRTERRSKTTTKLFFWVKKHEKEKKSLLCFAKGKKEFWQLQDLEQFTKDDERRRNSKAEKKSWGHGSEARLFCVTISAWSLWQGCQIFLGTTYVPKQEKMYQKGGKKANCHKICQMAGKLTKLA
jgi:hypothetical protein